MKLGSLVKIKPNNACLGLRMDEELPFLLKEESLMILLSVGRIEGFCKVLLLEQKKPVVLTVNVSVLESMEESENQND
jgi:hypothetical protein